MPCAGQSDVLPRHPNLPQWNGNGFVSGLATKTRNGIIFDGHGGAKTSERWDVGHHIRDVEQGPDGSLWMVEDANPGALIYVAPQVITSRQVNKKQKGRSDLVLLLCLSPARWQETVSLTGGR